MGQAMRFKLACEGLLVLLDNYYTIQGAQEILKTIE